MSRVSTPVFCTIAYRRLAGREPVGLAELVQRLAYFVARHAPSPHNVQPWRVKLISDDCAELFIDGARTLRANASNPDGGQLFAKNESVPEDDSRRGQVLGRRGFAPEATAKFGPG